MARAGRRYSRRAQFALKAVPAVVALACAGMQTSAQAVDLADIDFFTWDAAMHGPGAQWRTKDAANVTARQAQFSAPAAVLASQNRAAGQRGVSWLQASGWGYGANPASSGDAIALTWFGGTGDWMVAANWSPVGGPPGAGDTATINAGNAQLAVGTAIAGLQMNGGQVSGNGTLTVSGASQWTGGAHNGTGTSQFDGGLAITGANDKNLGGGRVLNVGDTTWSGNTATNNNRIRFTGGTINSNGTWTDSNAFDAYTYDYSGTNAFNNIGTYDKLGNTTTTMSVAYNNSGTTNVEAGTFAVSSAFTNHGLVQTAAGATFLGSNAVFANAGILAGNGTVATHLNGDIVNDGGSIAPGIGGVGHLGITGSLVNAATGRLDFDLASLASFDTLAVSDDVRLAGELGVWNLGYTPVLGDSFVVMTFASQLDSHPFDSIGVYGFAPGTEFTAVYNLHDVTLTVSAVAAVPEPQTLALMLAGLGVIGLVARRRRA